MTEQKERSQIHSQLRAAGIQHTLEELCDDPRIGLECTAELLALLNAPYSLLVRTCIARALFARKPSRAQKREAVDILLTLFREHRDRRGEGDHCLSTLAMNELASSIEADRADDVIRMAIDPRYGALRSSLTYVLYRLGTPGAITCLRELAKDPVIASAALYKLARINGVDGVVELCDAALKVPGIQYADMIKQTRTKAKRQRAKMDVAPSHVTQEPIPEGLPEWSTNLDADELPNALRRIAKHIPRGFGKAEVAEMQCAAERLTVDQDVRFKFDVELNDDPAATVWLELFCDDEEAFDLAVFGDATLIKRLDGTARPTK